jgi:acyl CoA:acetate/3-ketoacid CoA transferase
METQMMMDFQKEIRNLKGTMTETDYLMVNNLEIQKMTQRAILNLKENSLATQTDSLTAILSSKDYKKAILMMMETEMVIGCLKVIVMVILN